MRVIALVIVIAAAGAALFAQDVADMDKSVKPGNDFYHYANGHWLKNNSIPPGQQSYDTRAEINARTRDRVRGLLQEAAGSHAANGSTQQKVGGYYASFMDMHTIEAKKLTPLAGELSQISAIGDRKSLSAYLGNTLNGEVDGLIANADHIFGLWINQGFLDADHNYVHLWQGGLGMPDREDYLDPSPKLVDLRNQYQAHIAKMLRLAGTDDAGAKAAQVLSLEIKIAQAFAPDSDASDVYKQNNPWKQADFPTKAPGIDWDAYFKAAGLKQQSVIIVWQPTAVTGVAALVTNEKLDIWKDYLRFHLVEHYASALPKAVAEEYFAFHNTILAGGQSAPDRTTVAVAATNGALGQAVGQLYTQRYFPPEAKAKAQAMAADLVAAFRARISNLSWMTPATKEKALAKLAALEVIVGYPDTWIDYSTLEVARADALGNMRRAEDFLRARNLAKLGQPVDPIEWPINPQSPGAVIMFSPNAEFFSAGILQPPYFDPRGDPASNYGSAGAGMAHEITHSFDQLGVGYDERGRLAGWWTALDVKQYQPLADKLAAQLEACPLPGACIKVKRVLTESAADLAGLEVAHDAYLLSLHGRPDVMVGGLTGEQRFLLAFAQRWRKLQDEAALRAQLANDIHVPSEYRSNLVRNIDAWYQAFGVSPGDKLYIKPEDRVRIW